LFVLFVFSAFLLSYLSENIRFPQLSYFLQSMLLDELPAQSPLRKRLLVANSSTNTTPTDPFTCDNTMDLFLDFLNFRSHWSITKYTHTNVLL
jgi:hypothetical protein